MTKQVFVWLMGIPLISMYLIWLTWAAWGNKFLHWLKGSRTSYFISHDSGTMIDFGCKLRRFVGPPVIEISRGPCRKQSQIYSQGSMLWLLTQDWEKRNADWVRLEDVRGIPVETALRLINTYSSLQAMLDRIAELEKGLATSQLSRQELFAAMMALRRIITADKQRYKSPAAKNIASYVEIFIQKARDVHEPEPLESQILDWMRFGPTPKS